MSNKLEAILTMDSKGFSAACTKAGAEIKTMEASGSRIGTAFKAAGIVAAAGIGVVAFGLWECVKAAEEASVITAEVNSIIATTGGVANVTGKEIEALGTAIQNKTGYDHDQVRSAAAMLLTFPKVRNEVGAGNDIFNQAIDLSADLARKMGMDLPAAAKLLGKALGEPVRGVTALQRQGVMLTDQQKEQVKAFVASGDMLSAQKVILRELNTEVGLVAESYGQTLPGKIDILKGKFGEMKEIIGNVLLPVLTDMITKMSNWNWDKIGQGIASFIKTLGTIPSGLGTVVNEVQRAFINMELIVIKTIGGIADILEHIPGIGAWATSVKQDAARAMGEMNTNLMELKLAADVANGTWDAANAEVTASMAQMGPAAVAKMTLSMNQVAQAVAAGKIPMATAMAGDMNGVLSALVSGSGVAKPLMAGLTRELANVITDANFYTATTGQMHQMAAAISENTGVPITTVLALMNTLRGEVNNTDLKGAMDNAMKPVPGVISSYGPPSFAAAMGVGGATGTGLQSGLLSGNIGVWNAAAQLHQAAIDGIGNLYPPGLSIGQGFGYGISHGIGSMVSGVVSSINSMISAAKTAAKQAAGVGCPDPWPFTQELGGGFADGIATGIKNQSHLAENAASGLIGNLGGSFPSVGLNINGGSFPSGGNTTSTSTATNNVTIHVNGAGNPVSVAQEVRRVLDNVTANATHLQRVT